MELSLVCNIYWCEDVCKTDIFIWVLGILETTVVEAIRHNRLVATVHNKDDHHRTITTTEVQPQPVRIGGGIATIVAMNEGGVKKILLYGL